MAVTKAEKAAYNDYIKSYKSDIEEARKAQKELELKKKKMPGIEGYLNIEIALYSLKIINLNLQMNDASVEMLNVRNEKFLNDARKEYYKILQLMEETVGTDIDRSLKENEEHLEKIDRFSPEEILNVVKELIGVLQLIIDKLGEGSKWRWSFVELHGRTSVIIKNIINFSDIQKYRDPRSEYYHERQELMDICKRVLNESAKNYRNKYELSTKAPEDILRSIEMLTTLRRIHILFGESEEAEKLKNTINALRARLDADEKQSDKQKQDEIEKKMKK